jgi:hypothetical protein
MIYGVEVATCGHVKVTWLWLVDFHLIVNATELRSVPIIFNWIIIIKLKKK